MVKPAQGGANIGRGAALGVGVGALAGFLVSRVAGLQAAITAGYLAGLLAWLHGVGGGAALSGWLAGHEAHAAGGGWRRHLTFSTDHKVIGIQYLCAVFLVFLIAGTMAIVIRAELARPGLQFLTHETYGTAMGLHGIGMIVVALTLVIGGLGNFALPLMLGARDMALPRLNALSFWLLPPAVALLLATPLLGGFDFGWTAYAPLSVQGGPGRLLFLLAFVTAGSSSILGGVNVFATILALRAPGMTLFRMPIFAWSMLAASLIVLLATSVVASSLIMVIFDRTLGTAFYSPNRGGSALLYQHLFWFYSHPAVYIMGLPAFGLILEILPVFSRKPLFAYRTVAVSFIAIVIMSFIVWAHHLFTSGMWNALSIPFMVTTELISVPTGVVFLAVLGTIWQGKIRLRVPMLFALGMVASFLIGGLTGIFLADVPTDLHLQDTYFVVAHFHYTIVGGTIFAFFAGFHYWFPKMTGRMLDERLGQVQFWLFFLGFNLTFTPMFWLGTRGMRRRVSDYPPEWGNVHLFASLMALLVVASVVVMIWNVVRSLRRGDKASANPWDARTLEWTTSSPPPPENFARLPTVSSGPYQYGR